MYVHDKAAEIIKKFVKIHQIQICVEKVSVSNWKALIYINSQNSYSQRRQIPRHLCNFEILKGDIAKKNNFVQKTEIQSTLDVQHWEAAGSAHE